MKHPLKLTALLAAVLIFAACEKNNDTRHERNIVYTVDADRHDAHLKTDAEFDALLDRFCDYAEGGSTVTFYRLGTRTSPSAKSTKDATTYSTTDREEMKRWMAEMEDAGKTVTVTYNSNTGTWNGTAYATAPQEQQEGCYTGVLVMHEFDQLISLQISTDSILIIFNNTTYYESGYIELDDTTYYVGDTVTLFGELVTVGPEDYWTMGGSYLNIGPRWVDLGLPSGLLWASRNVGAVCPWEYGNYYAWGETQPKSIYYWNTYAYCQPNEYEDYLDSTDYQHRLTKYCPNPSYGYNGYSDTLPTLLPEDDAATVNWGDGARTPTKMEWYELKNYCTFTWSNEQGRNGITVTGPNGNSIFLPSAGWTEINEIVHRQKGCGYLTSTIFENNPSQYYKYFNNNSFASMYAIPDYRYTGMPVRAVRPRN